MAVGDTYVFPGFLAPVLTQLFFPKPPTTFLTCFCRGEKRKYAGKRSPPTGDRTHNHQIISQTRSPLSHPGGSDNISKNNLMYGSEYGDGFAYLELKELNPFFVRLWFRCILLVDFLGTVQYKSFERFIHSNIVSS